jgi:hypothetical protein
MKRKDNSSAEIKNLDLLVSKLTENEILNTQTLSSVKGGEGEAGGSIPGSVMPPKL